MKRIALYVASGFLAGLLFQYAVLTPHVLAQSPIAPQGPLANQRFLLVDEGHNPAGTLSFDSAGTPVISVMGQYANRLRGRVTRVLCEIRPWTAATPLGAGN
jgi:hypothetical protein